MKLSFFLISALAGFAMAAPAEAPVQAKTDSEMTARQINQPSACFYCGRFFHQCEDRKYDDCRGRTCRSQRGQCRRCGYCY